MTVKTQIVRIGNSKGVRIPKSLLLESRLGTDVELRVRRGEIRILPVRAPKQRVADTLILSERALAKDWKRPEEEAAWQRLQQAPKRLMSPASIRAEIAAYRRSRSR